MIKKDNARDGKAGVIKIFDGIASRSSWERLYSGRIDRISYNFITRQRAVEELLEPCISGKVLDIGCGSGDLAVFYVKKGALYTGVDLSSHMIERAGLNCAELVRSQKAEFRVADCENLPFAEGEFDILSAVALIEYLPDPSRALDEISRIVKKGGYVLITVPNKNCINNRVRHILKPLINALFPLYMKIKKSPLASMKDVKHYCYTQEEIDLLMQKRGFQKAGDRYTNFHIITHPLDHLIPGIYMKISERIDRGKLGKKYRNWAANYIALYKKG